MKDYFIVLTLEVKAKDEWKAYEIADSLEELVSTNHYVTRVKWIDVEEKDEEGKEI